jgi:hypothetical protein
MKQSGYYLHNQTGSNRFESRVALMMRLVVFKSSHRKKEISLKHLAQYLLLIVLLLSSVTYCSAQGSKSGEALSPPPPAVEYNQSIWKDFSPPDISFKVLMPGKPTYLVQQLPTRMGLIPQHIYYVKTGNGEYVVSYFELPTGSYDAQAIRKMLDGGRDNMLAQAKNNKLLSEREIKIEGYDGREMLVEDADAIFRNRAFVAGKRVYNIGLSMSRNAVFKTGRPSANPADRTDFYETTSAKFLDSFKLIPGGQGTTITPSQPPPPPPPPAIEYNPNSWKELSSTEGSFRVVLPGIPTLTNQETKTDVGIIPLHIYQLTTNIAAFVVMYGDFPVRPEDPNVIKKILDSARDGILAKHKDNKLLDENEIVLNGEVGREWLIEDGDLIYRHRTFFIKGRLYQIMLGMKRDVAFKTGQPGANPNESSDLFTEITRRFFDSFKVIPRQASTATPR